MRPRLPHIAVQMQEANAHGGMTVFMKPKSRMKAGIRVKRKNWGKAGSMAKLIDVAVNFPDSNVAMEGLKG